MLLAEGFGKADTKKIQLSEVSAVSFVYVFTHFPFPGPFLLF